MLLEAMLEFGWRLSEEVEASLCVEFSWAAAIKLYFLQPSNCCFSLDSLESHLCHSGTAKELMGFLMPTLGLSLCGCLSEFLLLINSCSGSSSHRQYGFLLEFVAPLHQQE